MKNDNECELNLGRALDNYGLLWHVCTSGEKVGILFSSPADYKYAVSAIAISAFEARFKILVDTVMSTHIHVLGFGNESNAHEFIHFFRYRIEKYLSSSGRKKSLKNIEPATVVPVTTLTACRNEICYIARNAYAADSNILPFTHIWGSAHLLFNYPAQNIKGENFNETVTYIKKRFFLRRRVFLLADEYCYSDGMILPSSYADYKLAESFFRSPHHYFYMLTKNVEAFSETAKKLSETGTVTYEELNSIAWQIAKHMYNVANINLLPDMQKRELAIRLKFDYNGTAKQIKRILNLSDNLMEELFPLKNK